MAGVAGLVARGPRRVILVVDAVAGQPFRTPAVLAYILFKRPTLDVSV